MIILSDSTSDSSFIVLMQLLFFHESLIHIFKLCFQESFVHLQEILSIMQIDFMFLCRIRGGWPLLTFNFNSEAIILRIN